MKLEFTDFDVKQMCERTIASQLYYECNHTHSSIQARFREGLDRAMTNLKPEIESAVTNGILAALASPEFKKRIQEELIKTCADKFGGALSGIMKAAAKRAATDAGLQKGVESVVVSSISELFKP